MPKRKTINHAAYVFKESTEPPIKTRLLLKFLKSDVSSAFLCSFMSEKMCKRKKITYLTPDEHKKFVTVFCISLTEPNGPRKNLKTYKKLEYSLC